MIGDGCLRGMRVHGLAPVVSRQAASWANARSSDIRRAKGEPRCEWCSWCCSHAVLVGRVAAGCGTFTAVTVTAPPASAVANPAPAAGERRSATRLNFTVSGTAKLSVDVGTGNALFTDRLITLPGVTADVPINLYYNSSVVGHGVPSSVTGTSNSGWSITGFDQRLISNSDGTITYYGPGGLTGVFTSNGAGGYTAPVQFRADLETVTTGGWKMTMHGSTEVLIFTAGGRLIQDKDRNGNITTFNYSNGLPASVVCPPAGRPSRAP